MKKDAKGNIYIAGFGGFKSNHVGLYYLEMRFLGKY